MIDWLGVLTNSLWIVGLAGFLATASYYDYVAASQKKPRRVVFGSRAFTFYFSLSAIVFCLGVALSGGQWWERALWGILCLVFAWQTWQSKGARLAELQPDQSEQS